MKKLIAAAVFSFLIFFITDAGVDGNHQLASSATNDDYRVRLGMMGVLITYDNESQTSEYKYICKIFKDELGQILSRRPLNLPERFFKVRIKESFKEPDLDEPVIAVSLDDQSICWVRISQLGTPEQMRGFVRFSSELIFRRLRELSDDEDNVELPVERPKRIKL